MSAVMRAGLAAGFVASVCGKLLKAMSWIQVQAGLLKPYLLNPNPVGRRVNWRFFSRMWATGGRGRGLLLPSSQGPGPALAAENCWSYELLLLTTRTFLPKHRTNPTASVWWCGANHLKEDVEFFWDTFTVINKLRTCNRCKPSWMCLPFLVKNSLEYLPARISFRGTFPSSSMIRAMWSVTHIKRWGHSALRKWIGHFEHLWFWNPIKCVTYLHLWSNHPPSEVQTDNLQ